MQEQEILKILLLSDLLSLDLKDKEIKNILNPVAKSKLRNLKKSVDSIISWSDNVMTDIRSQESFGELSDNIYKLVDKQIKEVLALN